MKSDCSRELVNELKQIWNNKDFVCGVLCNAGGSDAWMTMLEYIREAKKSDKKLTSDEIILLSLDLGEGDSENEVVGEMISLAIS